LEPFRSEYMFDKRVMGIFTCSEICAYFLRTRPLYFRAFEEPGDLVNVLGSKVYQSKTVGDLVRHLRVYMRCENFSADVICQEAAIPAWPGELVTTIKKEHAEHWVYESRKAGFESLRNLLPKGQDLKLELCVFHNLIDSPYSSKSENIRKKYNFLEAVKSTYFHFKDAGAGVKVR
ncbi:hypothetical protein GQ44DRAFT_574571, partial [Phaeosphaeriaceae sp. PMI808]